MQCIACYRNKYGIVTHCRIEHNGEIRDLDKDKIKQMIKSGTKISGLALTSKGYGHFEITNYQNYIHYR